MKKKLIVLVLAACVCVLLLTPMQAMAEYGSLSFGITSQEVTDMQNALISLGYLAPPADGYYGYYTEESVINFQNDYGLYPDGVAGSYTLELLYSLVSPAPAASEPAQASASSDISSVYLKIGSQGGDVVKCQNALAALGYYTGDVDGDYGQYTAISVSSFQSDNGLYADGEAGPVTLEVLYAKASGQPAPSAAPAASSSSSSSSELGNVYLVVGATGSDVETCQKALINLGYYNGDVDGYYGEYTAAAVANFQRDHGLYSDGEAGPVTMSILIGASQAASQSASPVDIPSGSLVYGSSGEDVANIQNKLSQLGYMSGGDGYFGDATFAAVCAFEAAHGTAYPSGIVTPSLYQQIMSETRGFAPVGPYSTYSEVVAVQKRLRDNRMVFALDGGYGEQTTYAILQIQKMFGLPQTGVCDALTMYYVYAYDGHVDNQNDVQGYYSATNYLIYVNATTNRLYVYTGSIWNWNLLYNWECATGTSVDPTTTGEFTTNFRGYSFGDNEYTCYYFTSFNGPYYMHSTLYHAGTWSDLDARLGMNLSHGCVRMDTQNAQWIYNNIPLGTKVVVVP